VIVNLIVNAAHAISDKLDAAPGGRDALGKGRITISTSRVGGTAEVRVQDTGMGIPAAIRERIFDPFFTTKPVGKGTGQGLALAHSVIVKKHGGELEVETEVGVGTTFIIRLPLEDERNAAAA
jgi:signal transduction histidine kinase